jgi:nucleoside-diphosphate-sugar epimerase
MARIAVTGASGFVGRHVVPSLLAEGHEVRALDRRPFSGESVASVQGDVRNLEQVRTALETCELVVHLAPGFSAGDDAKESVTAGTQNVVTAARESSVQRIVFLSCLGADAASASPFYAALWRAEQLVRGSEVPFSILRPSLVLGRRDGVLQPLSALIRSLPVVPIVGRGENRLQPIDVDDLARCVLIALSSDGLQNETVSIGGPMFVTPRQLVDLVAGRLGLAKPKILIPAAGLVTLLTVLPASTRDLFSPPRIDQFRQAVVASPGIVERTFGFEPRSIVPKLAEYLA